MKITLFIGLNDKDTKRQEVKTRDAVELLAGRIAEQLGFGTTSPAAGVYTHEDGTTVIEETVRCEFFTDDLKGVKDFAQWAKRALNQESIAMEVTTPTFELV